MNYQRSINDQTLQLPSVFQTFLIVTFGSWFWFSCPQLNCFYSPSRFSQGPILRSVDGWRGACVFVSFPWSSCHFLALRPHCLKSKCTCTSLCAYGCVGLKMRCGQAHWWRVAILVQRKVICATDKKNPGLKSLAHISLLFKGRIIKSPICSYIGGGSAARKHCTCYAHTGAQQHTNMQNITNKRTTM